MAYLLPMDLPRGADAAGPSRCFYLAIPAWMQSSWRCRAMSHSYGEACSSGVCCEAAV